jgi:hypothetical protein
MRRFLSPSLGFDGTLRGLPRSVLVVVAFVSGVAVAAVEVVDVAAVRHRDMPAALTVVVVMGAMLGTLNRLALVEVALM